MKNLVFFIGITLSLCNVNAQKNITENYSTIGINEVSINLKFAKSIELKNSFDNKIKIEGIININDNKKNNEFSLKESKVENTLKIKSDYGNTFDKTNNVTVTSSKDCEKSKSYVNCNIVITKYVVYVPKNVDLKIKSITGNVNTSNYNGNLELDLVSGDITIKKHSKKMNLKTVSGDIDVIVADASFKAETVTGMVYSNLDIQFENAKQIVGSKIQGTIKNGNASLKMVTVSGDVFLRKQL